MDNYPVKNLLAVEIPKDNLIIIETNPLVVVTDLLGIEYFSKIEVFNEGTSLWALGHSEKLNPGVYIITSASNQNLFKKTLVIQER